MDSLLDFPGLQTTHPNFRAALIELARKSGLDPDAVSAVISHESGYRPDAVNHEGAPAAGLIQFWRDTFPGVARKARMNVTWEQLPRLSAEEQLPLVMAYFELAGLGPQSSAGDYGVAVLLPSQIAAPDGRVVARRGSSDLLPGTHLKLGTIYAANRGLDRRHVGEFTVGDLREGIEAMFRAARERPPVMVHASPSQAAPEVASGGKWVPLALGGLAAGVAVVIGARMSKLVVPALLGIGVVAAVMIAKERESKAATLPPSAPRAPGQRRVIKSAIPGVPDVEIRPNDPGWLARELALHLGSLQAHFGTVQAARGHESKELVVAFQRAAGGLQADGHAGPATGVAMARRGVGALPLVMYWPKGSDERSLAAYRTALRAIAKDAGGAEPFHSDLHAAIEREHGQGLDPGPALHAPAPRHHTEHSPAAGPVA